MRASWPFCRESHQLATPAVRKVSGARQHPATIADSAKALGIIFSRLAGSCDAHEATARTLEHLCANLIIAQIQRYQHVRRRRPAKKQARASWPFCRGSREPSVASHLNGGYAATPRQRTLALRIRFRCNCKEVLMEVCFEIYAMLRACNCAERFNPTDIM
jgi:hypothetical protein